MLNTHTYAVKIRLRGGCSDLPTNHLPQEFTDVIIVPGLQCICILLGEFLNTPLLTRFADSYAEPAGKKQC